MASLKNARLGATNFVKPDYLAETGIVFNITGARARVSLIDGKETPVIDFNIEYVDNSDFEEGSPDWNRGEMKSAVMSLGENNARLEFVRYFENGGDELENIIIVEGERKGKRNAPWMFADAFEEEEVTE